MHILSYPLHEIVLVGFSAFVPVVLHLCILLCTYLMFFNFDVTNISYGCALCLCGKKADGRTTASTRDYFLCCTFGWYMMMVMIMMMMTDLDDDADDVICILLWWPVWTLLEVWLAQRYKFAQTICICICSFLTICICVCNFMTLCICICDFMTICICVCDFLTICICDFLS